MNYKHLNLMESKVNYIVNYNKNQFCQYSKKLKNCRKDVNGMKHNKRNNVNVNIKNNKPIFILGGIIAMILI